METGVLNLASSRDHRGRGGSFRLTASQENTTAATNKSRILLEKPSAAEWSPDWFFCCPDARSTETNCKSRKLAQGLWRHKRRIARAWRFSSSSLQIKKEGGMVLISQLEEKVFYRFCMHVRSVGQYKYHGLGPMIPLYQSLPQYRKTFLCCFSRAKDSQRIQPNPTSWYFNHS